MSSCVGILVLEPAYHSFVALVVVEGIHLAQLVGVYHRKHFAEALPNSCNSLRGISKGHLAPWEVVRLFAIEIDHVLCTAGTRALDRLCGEHRSVFIIVSGLVHKDIVHIL